MRINLDNYFSDNKIFTNDEVTAMNDFIGELSAKGVFRSGKDKVNFFSFDDVREICLTGRGVQFQMKEPVLVNFDFNSDKLAKIAYRILVDLWREHNGADDYVPSVAPLSDYLDTEEFGECNDFDRIFIDAIEELSDDRKLVIPTRDMAGSSYRIFRWDQITDFSVLEQQGFWVNDYTFCFQSEVATEAFEVWVKEMIRVYG